MLVDQLVTRLRDIDLTGSTNVPEELLGEGYLACKFFGMEGKKNEFLDEVKRKIASGVYSVGIVLSLSQIIYAERDSGNQDELKEIQKRLFLHGKLDLTTGLVPEYVSEGRTVFYLETNYNYALALLLAVRSNQNISIWAEMELRSLVSSIKKSFYFEGINPKTGTYRPEFYYSISVSWNKDIKKIKTDDRREDLIGAHILYIWRLIFYVPSAYAVKHEDNLLIEFPENIEQIAPDVIAFGSMSRKIVDLTTITREDFDQEIFASRYPFTVSIAWNSVMQTRLANAISFTPFALSVVDRCTDIPNDSFTVEYSGHFGAFSYGVYSPLVIISLAFGASKAYSNNDSDLGFYPYEKSEIYGVNSIENISPYIEPVNVSDFSWNNTPFWPTLEDPLTRSYHDAFVAIGERSVRTIERFVNKELDRDKMSYETAKWWAYLHGVPARWIGSLTFEVLKNLTPKQKAIQKRRSTESSFLNLQSTLMPSWSNYSLNRGWVPFKNSVYRHTNAAIWTVEVEPNIFGYEGIKTNHALLQESYTSARYMLITTATGVKTRLGTARVAWQAGVNYPPGTLALYGGELWRKSAAGTTGTPEDSDTVWSLTDRGAFFGDRAFDPTVTYQKGEIIQFEGQSYILNADSSIGMKPSEDWMMWNKVIARSAVVGQANKDYYISSMAVANGAASTNTMLVHCGTAWRYPNSPRMGNPSYRFRTKDLLRVNVYIALRGQGVYTNEPVMKQGGYRSSSQLKTLNETQSRWVNAGNQWRNE